MVGYDRHPEGESSELVFRYTVRLPPEHWFHPTPGAGRYWFRVTAVYLQPSLEVPYLWGWTTGSQKSGSPALIDYGFRRAEPSVMYQANEPSAVQHFAQTFAWPPLLCREPRMGSFRRLYTQAMTASFDVLSSDSLPEATPQWVSSR